ncbi:MAG: hypothetical protein Q9220_002425 [cf. Caloplaca sp. 1 TL-2023]
MLAARDQENLVHGHQAAAAAKPLNQGIKQLAPKTPGNKATKTPFKLPLNDENGANMFVGGKKIIGNGNEDTLFGHKKNAIGENKAFITPMGPRNRAPLGMKTTNAKAKAFQTPALAPAEHDIGKTNKKSISARKPKPKISHPESTKLQDILANKEALAEREVEYMPPKPKDLPDVPDDGFDDLDFSILRQPYAAAQAYDHIVNQPDAEGLSLNQRRELKEKTVNDWWIKKGELESTLAAESDPLSCMCYPECWGDECIQSVAQRKEAQENFKKAIVALGPKPFTDAAKSSKPKGPSIGTSRAAVSALANPKRPALGSKPQAKNTAPIKKSLPFLSREKQIPLPNNPSAARHATATAASRTTMGYSKGRATSATMRRTILPGKENQVPEKIPDYSLEPAAFIKRYGVPRYGSDKWHECKLAGCLDGNLKPTAYEEELGEAVKANDEALAKYFREEAEKDFVLEL